MLAGNSDRLDDYIHEVELRHGSSGHPSVEYTEDEIRERRALKYGNEND